MLLSHASLIRPWKALPRIMGFYAAAGLVATAVTILANGFVAHPDRTNQLLPSRNAGPSPQQENPAATSPDLVAESMGSNYQALSSSALVFAALPPEINDGAVVSAGSMDESIKPSTIASQASWWITSGQSVASVAVGDLTGDGPVTSGGVALALVNDRYAKFPNSTGDRAFSPGLYVTPADLPRLIEALGPAKAANPSASVLITSSNPFFMRDLKRRLDSK